MFSNNFLLLFTERLCEDVFERFAYPESYTEEQICFTSKRLCTRQKINQLLCLVRQLASALHWMHFKGVVHSNVEPSNLMFASKTSWQLKLIDFGRASLAEPPKNGNKNQPVKKLSHLLPGFADWAAPEVLAYERSRTRDLLPPPPANPQTGTYWRGVNYGKKLASYSDMWGLGMITFCLLAGYHPFASDDDSEEEVSSNAMKVPNIITEY